MSEAAEHVSRQLYMVLSPRSLPYARLTLKSLLDHADETLSIHLITDSAEDKQVLSEVMSVASESTRHGWTVTAESELLDLEASKFGNYPNIRAFRHGHPCWRKVTDPLLVAGAGEELVLLDPDVLFPNTFRFEVTPSAGLLLMWQRPNCLLPDSVVQRALNAGVPLARHVDIGVCHWRAGTDLDWLDWLLQLLGGHDLPRAMHVEAIVWAAIAMREGGGYLNPKLWACWHRTQWKRVLQKAGVNGNTILRSEPWTKIKCFHAGGAAKWWLAGLPSMEPGVSTDAKATLPFQELSPSHYRREQAGKRILQRFGYYRMLGAS